MADPNQSIPTPPQSQSNQWIHHQPSTQIWPVYKWSISYLRPYLGLLIAVIAMITLLSTAELIIPKFIQTFIDHILPERNWRMFYILIACLGGVIVVVVASSMIQNLLNRQLREKVFRDLQFAIFSHLRKLGFAYYEQNPVGQTLSFLNTEVAAMQSLYREHFPWLINNVIFSMISIAMMATTSLHLTAVVAPCFLIYYIFGPFLERKASISGKMMAADRIQENQKVYESISALTEFRVNAAERWDLARYLDKVQTLNTRMIRTYWYAYLRGTNRRISYNIGAVVIFIYGYYLLRQDTLLVGQFVAFLLYYFTAMHRLTAVVTNITEQKILMHQAERLYQFMEQQPQVKECEHPVHLSHITGKLQFHEVTFAYIPGQPVLRDFDLSIAAGQRLALVGTSGNGKSTVLKLIGRFYDPQKGRITLDDVPIDQLSLAALRRSIGFVFQDTYIFGSSIRDNLLFGKPEATEAELLQAAKAAYAHDFIMELPSGYATIVGERGVKLSGGQKQRLAIARMLIHNPAIIVLDEATSALDNTSETEVQKAFDTLLNGGTLIAIAHRLTTIQDYDQIAVIEGGRVVELGTYEQLLAAGQSFSQLVNGMEQQSVAKEESHA
jgi:ATP-binding cassette, subfamily B, bacterial